MTQLQKQGSSSPEKIVPGAAVQSSVAQMYQGPIPPPDLFREYDQILPGSAERILKMAENEQSQRLQRQMIQAQSEASLSERGQFCGFILASGAFFLCGLAIWKGSFPSGIAMFLTTVGSIIGSFFIYKKSEK